jgi:hypothetical protein
MTFAMTMTLPQSTQKALKIKGSMRIYWLFTNNVTIVHMKSFIEIISHLSPSRSSKRPKLGSPVVLDVLSTIRYPAEDKDLARVSHIKKVTEERRMRELTNTLQNIITFRIFWPNFIPKYPSTFIGNIWDFMLPWNRSFIDRNRTIKTLHWNKDITLHVSGTYTFKDDFASGVLSRVLISQEGDGSRATFKFDSQHDLFTPWVKIGHPEIPMALAEMEELVRILESL